MNSHDQDSDSNSIDPQPLPGGFRYSGVACGIKPSGKLDLSIIHCDRAVTAVGVYTQNQIVAPPVVLCRNRTPSDSLRAVVTNSGNANACTGEEGMANALEMTNQVASLAQCDLEDVLVMSTGVIGQQLPMDSVRAGISSAFTSLDSNFASFIRASDAICTTDQYRKVKFRDVEIDGHVYRIAAMAKGAGMIEPNMATMLAVVLTDAPLSEKAASEALSSTANLSFNRISVDGHTSTNDTMLLLASGEGESLSGEGLARFQEVLNEAAVELAKMIVADGEGATHVMSIRVSGARSDGDAVDIARTVAASPLVKTAVTGGDPNWGRIVSAAGYAEARIKPELTALKICGVTIYRDGSPVPFDEAKLSGVMKDSPEVDIDLQVGDGPGKASYWSSDLTTDYVTFNSEYTT